MTVSIIIPTVKSKVLTEDSLEECPYEYKVTKTKLKGLGRARNHGARLAKGKLLVFLDDDVTLEAEAWKHILSTKPGQLKMYDNGCPRIPYSTRVMCIWSEDFWKLGGFDEEIVYYGEDVDFLIRALDAGLEFEAIPAELIHHEEHLPRMRYNMRVFLGARADQAYCMLKHRGKYFYIVHGSVWQYLKKVVRRPRNYFPIFPALIYQIFKKLLT